MVYYTQSHYREIADKQARVADQLKKARAGAMKREQLREKTNKTGSPAQESPDTLAAPRTVKSKMAVYNDPIVGSSLKRKANGHTDIPAPKKANTKTFLPRIPGERYQGTAAQAPSGSGRVLKSKPVTQQKARHNDRVPTTKIDLDISSPLGRKRDAEDNLNENTAKKQKVHALESKDPMLTQGSKAGKSVSNTVITVKSAPKSNFFSSFYPKGSKLQASAGRVTVSTEIVKTAVPSTGIKASCVERTAPPKAPSVMGSFTEGTEKSFKRKRDDMIIEGNVFKKRRQDDASATRAEENIWGNGKPTVKAIPKKESRPEGKALKNEALTSQRNANKAENSGRKLPSAADSEPTPTARIRVKKDKKSPSECNNNNESPAKPAEPRGISNEANACYIISVVQAIANIPEMANHYRALANKTIPEVAKYVAAANKKGWKGSAEKQLKELLEKKKADIRLGAYLGVLLNEMLDPDTFPETPYSHAFRQVCGVLLASDPGEGYDGKSQQDCMEYFEKLLDHLDMEDRTEKNGAPSVVQELFGLEAFAKIECQSCGRVWDSSQEKKFAYTTSVPHKKDGNSSVCITECLDAYSDPEPVDVHCKGCGKTIEASKRAQLRDLSPYVLVKLNRVMVDIDKNLKAVYKKNPRHVEIPSSDIVTMKDGAKDVRYRVIGTLKHQGMSFQSGHWTSRMKIDGQWWQFNDELVDKKDSRLSVVCMVVLERSPLSFASDHDPSPMDPILQGLNQSQQDAVTSVSDVLQILAPPGSGKTRTLTSRVAYLLRHHQYKPWDIICLTFTVKSSREMKERIANLLGNDTARRLILGTFHSVCRRYLVTYGHLIGVHQGFGIADSSDSTAIVKRIIKRLGLSIDPKKAQSRISSSKSKGLKGPDLQGGKKKVELDPQLAQNKNVEQQEFFIVFEAYQSQLAKSNLLDYDDLLLRCVDLLRQHPACVSNVEVVLIDEFQDTNVVQFDLMRLFAAKNKRVTTVGDPDQSIYGWRSAEIRNLERMQQQYPGMLTIHLKDNYRSSGAILLAADEVIQQDASRPSKSLLPTHCLGTMPVLRRLPSAEIEALWIVSELQRTVGLTGRLLAYCDFAILLRSASLSRQVESAMGRAGIPYRMVGGKKFFDRLEVKILLDYLRVVSQPNNNDAISRIINIPGRGLGATTVKGLLEEAETRKVALWTLLRNSTQNTTRTKLSKAAESGLGNFVNLILTCRNRILDASNPTSPETILGYIIEKLDFQHYLEKSHADDHEARWANVEELIAQASEYTVYHTEEWNEDEDLPNIEGLEKQRGNAVEEALAKFLANVALASELQKEEGGMEWKEAVPSQVTISTIHAAKGLEWPVVFVPSAYEGCIPHSRAEDTDEERRLLYVAMTRAQALLYVSCSTRNSQREETALSPFLSTKPVSNLLVSQGPTINSSCVNDIARILRRDIPTQARISEACETLQSMHDNLWPLTGQEDPKETGAKWSKWDSNESSQHPSKRRKTQDSERSGTDAMTACVNSYVAGHVGITTTMQSSSTFSCNTGFISAAAQLQHVDKQKKMDPRPSGIEKPSNARKEGAESISKSSLGRRGGQSNLMSFLGMKAEKDRRNTSLNKCAPESPGNISAGGSHTFRNETIADPTATTNQILSGDLGPTPGTPHLLIPEALATRRLQPFPNTNRPRPLLHEDELPRKKPYAFLSSSPPHVEELVEAAENQCGDQSPTKSIVRVEESQVVPRRPDIMPSRTFYTTSVAQLQTEGAPRKTLGVRRSMNGWSARGSHGFSVPKMI